MPPVNEVADNSTSAHGRIYPFQFILPLAIAIYKAAALQREIGAKGIIAWQILAGDSLPLLFFSLILILTSLCARKWLRLTLLALSASLCALYLVDTFVILNFNDRLSLSYVAEFLPEWRVALTFLRWWHVIIIPIGALLWTTSYQLPQQSARRVLALSVLCPIFSLIPPPVSSTLVSRFGFNKIFNETNISLPLTELYPATTVMHALSATGNHPPLRLPPQTKKVILLMIESLSAAHSARVSGINNMTPEFDRISNDGTLYTNFFSNYGNTEGAMVALLSGALPFSYPSGPSGLYEAFSFQPSVVHQFANLGFTNIFLAATPLHFRDKIAYLKSIGFSELQGRDDLSELANAPRFTFDSPADGQLYDVALERIAALNMQNQPYFLTIETGTGHLPYIDPLGRGNTPENVWGYIDGQIGRFYNELQRLNFFGDGILIVLGDHRHMRPMTADEELRYGSSARARIPLLILGAGVNPGRIDQRFFQESDLFAKLSTALQDGGTPLSPNPIFVEHFSYNYATPQTRTRFEIYPESAQGKLGLGGIVEGAELRWERPTQNLETALSAADRLAVEESIHTSRALHQHQKGGIKQGCLLAWESGAETGIASNRNGVNLEMYNGAELSGVLNHQSKRFISSRILSTIDYPELSVIPQLPNPPFALRFASYLKIEEPGDYWFRVESDDGACLAIDRQIVVSAETSHPFAPDDGVATLAAGLHRIGLRYFQRDGNAGIRLSWSRGEVDGWRWQTVPANLLFLSEQAALSDNPTPP